MLKKLLIGSLCFVCIAMFVGCGQMDSLTLVKNNMSERCDVYFYSDNDDFNVSIASGQREESYIYDGKSQPKVDFALLVAEIDSSESEMCQVSIDGEQSQVLLEFNYRTGKHMADLQKKLTGQEQIQVTYLDKTANMECKSKDFAVSSDKAIELGCQHLKDFIEPLCDGNNFKGECYLRVMDKLTGEENGTVWLFSVLSSDCKIANVIISTSQPQVLADDVTGVI